MAGLSDRLFEFVASFRAEPFDWEGSHCCHMPAAWVEHIEGRHIVLPRVTGQLSALRRVIRSGGFASAITVGIGRGPLPCVSDARVGDIVAWRAGVAGPGYIGVCGVMIVDGFAVVSTGMDAVLRPVDGAVAAWRVGL